MRLQLNQSEVAEINQLLSDVDKRYGCFEEEQFLHNAFLYAHELPERIRRFVHEFRIHEPDDGVCIIGGFPVDDSQIGLTPSHWVHNEDADRTRHERAMMLIVSALLGDAFGWKTQQQGRLIHDVLPIKGDEYEQIGTGSEQTIWWHTEDAFHPYSADYLMLMCLRNEDQVETTVSRPDMSKLSEAQIEVLFEPRFVINPDNSHKSKNAAGAASNAEYYDEPQGLIKQPILFGDPERPYMCLDPYFMETTQHDPQAQDALDALCRNIDSNVEAVVLKAGDIAIVDNQTVVHGRNAFKARFDGTDRWLKRLNIARDIRKSRSNRHASQSRVIW